MDILYFLIFVGVCAVAIVWFTFRAARLQKIKAQKAKQKATHYEHRASHSPILHSHTRSLKPASADMWAEHRQHASGVRRVSESLIARKVRFDDELEDGADELKMKEFRYTPTEFYETGGRKN